MTAYGWESGTIKLPSAEFARVRQAVADAVTKDSQAIYDRAQTFWKGLTAKQKSDPDAYEDALRELMNADERLARAGYGGVFRGTAQRGQLPAGFYNALSANVLTNTGSRKVRRLQKTDLMFPTNRATYFNAGVEAGIYFQRKDSTVHWGVPENNHAVVDAHNTSPALALFSTLATVKWTRGTGGVITGNDEYNQESREEGRGANYTTGGFGPIGAVEAPQRTADFTMSDGKRVRRDDFAKMRKAAEAAQRRQWTRAAQQQGHRPAGSAGGAGGQFDRKFNSDPEAHF